MGEELKFDEKDLVEQLLNKLHHLELEKRAATEESDRRIEDLESALQFSRKELEEERLL